MKNITNKDLQRMISLMGNKKPITENKIHSSLELIKKSPNGKYYGIVRETKKYYIKESNDGSNFDFIGGTANKLKNQFESYEQAVRRLNLMLENTDVLTPDIIEEKKFVIKTKKKKSVEPTTDETPSESSFGDTEDSGGFDFGGGEETEEEGDSFDFGGGEETEEEGDSFDFGGGEGETEEETEGETDEETDEDLELEDDGEDSIKSIQRMTGKLGQKLRDTDDVSSDMKKWVGKSVLSALGLEDMDSEDKKDLIRTIKKKNDEGSDEEFDFMNDKTMDRPIMSYMNNDMVDWNSLSDKEKSQIVNYPGDQEKPIMDWDEEIEDDSCSHCNGLGHDDITGEECEWCMGTGVQNMEDYMEGEFGPGDNELEGSEQIISDEDDEDNCSYCGDRNQPYYEDEPYETYPGINEPDWRNPRMDYMGKYAKKVKSTEAGKPLESHEKEEYLKQVFNKLGGDNKKYTIDRSSNSIVGDFGHIKVGKNSYDFESNFDDVDGLESKSFNFNKLGEMKDYVRKIENSEEYKRKNNEEFEDYMDDPYMMPQPAPARPQTRPETPTKPAKPGTDKPSPSKRPFTPPPHITPGEEPNPKAEYDEYGDEYYGPTEGMDYMEDDTMEVCSACEGRGHEQGRIGFGRQQNLCITCAGTGMVPRMEADGEVDEPYIDSSNPMGYERGTSTLPKGMGHRFQYKEKFNFPFNIGENSKRNKRTIKEDHLNNKMASYEQEMAYEDVEDMARQHGMDVELCHKDRAKDPEEQTIYLDLVKKGKVVSKIRINTAGDIEMGHMTGKVFKGEPVDSHSDFDEVLAEKGIKMMPQTAPARPQTRPDTDTPTKPAKPGTDKPSPSKRPFTPPPHITPGEEPNPKAGTKKRKPFSYMDDKNTSKPSIEPSKPSKDKPKRPTQYPFHTFHIKPGEDPTQTMIDRMMKR